MWLDKDEVVVALGARLSTVSGGRGGCGLHLSSRRLGRRGFLGTRRLRPGRLLLSRQGACLELRTLFGEASLASAHGLPQYGCDTHLALVGLAKLGTCVMVILLSEIVRGCSGLFGILLLMFGIYWYHMSAGSRAPSSSEPIGGRCQGKPA